MTSKIKVDPRTFKIINQSQPQSQTQTATDSFTSDSESSTSVNSDAESVKVIKLDNTEQSGGLAKQNGPLITAPEVKIQPSQDRIIKPVVTNPPASNPPASNPPASNPPALKPNPPIPNVSNNDLFNYLSTKNQNQENSGKELSLSKLEESVDNDNESEINSETMDSEKSEELVEQQSQPQVEDTTQDVFDLTQNKLYQVLSKLFEDNKGNNISENLEKLNKLFESHNQIMEKMLNQLIIMNSNYKQVKVPESVQTSTKQAGNIVEFRKKLDRLDQKEQKKP
jgi:hypothetical protein